MLLDHDITSSDELSLNEQLRYRGPLAELLDTLPQQIALQNVDVLVRYLVVLEELHRSRGETAHGSRTSALHEEHYVGSVHKAGYLRVQTGRWRVMRAAAAAGREEKRRGKPRAKERRRKGESRMQKGGREPRRTPTQDREEQSQQ